MAKLLNEIQTENIESICEGTGDKKSWHLQGCMLRSEYRNLNNRTYPAATIARAVEEYDRNFISKNKALDCLGHEDSPNVSYDRVSHIITKLWREGNDWFGRARILDTPSGQILRSLAEAKVPIGISSRGTGSLSDGIVGNDFRLHAIDAVTSPSAGCFVEGLLEGADWEFDEVRGEWVKAARDKMRRMSSRQLAQEDVRIRLFQKWLDSRRSAS